MAGIDMFAHDLTVDFMFVLLPKESL